jgi:hypothetical protein
MHRVYNLTVDDLHTDFVAASVENVLVHNSDWSQHRHSGCHLDLV